MALSREQKEALVADVAEVSGNALSAVSAEYRGMTVEQMTELRVKARETGVYLRVVKNTLARRGMAGTDFECMSEALVGPLVLAFSMEDPGAAGRLMRDYAKACDKLEIKNVAIEGQLLPGSDIGRLADLPTRDQALAMLMGTMKAPVEKLARTLAEPYAQVVRATAAIGDQKEAA